ncbi:MAG: hypothetical protein E7231_14275 [Cellulosilyticum sp.]|nr:hypothetical protein [Cellulosilyticum sp.]
MYHIIRAEMMKLKHNKLMTVSFMMACLAPLLIIIKDVYLVTGVQAMGIKAWIVTLRQIILFLVVPIISGFVITVLIQKEYEEKTIISGLMVPISRRTFVLGKLCIWGILHMFLVLITLGVGYIGIAILFPYEITREYIIHMGHQFMRGGFFNFLTLIPIMSLAICQRKLFYPSLIMCLIVTAIGVGGVSMDGIWAVLLPWSAVSVLSSIELEGVYKMIGTISIIATGVIGVWNAIYILNKQDL